MRRSGKRRGKAVVLGAEWRGLKAGKDFINHMVDGRSVAHAWRAVVDGTRTVGREKKGAEGGTEWGKRAEEGGGGGRRAAAARRRKRGC